MATLHPRSLHAIGGIRIWKVALKSHAMLNLLVQETRRCYQLRILETDCNRFLEYKMQVIREHCMRGRALLTKMRVILSDKVLAFYKAKGV